MFHQLHVTHSRQLFAIQTITILVKPKCCFNLVDVDSDSNDGFEETTILLGSADLSTLLNDFDLIAHLVKALQSLDKRDCFTVSSAL
jgi:hypothetical protein